jgi:D-ribose pyranase
MKKDGILNASLNAAISHLGHGDMVVVADCGMPIPPGVTLVDLALVHGIPSFVDTLDALVGDAVFEGGIAAEEIRGTAAERWLTDRIEAVSYVSHAELKAITANARLFIRTGEATPYANVVLRCGVPF